MKGSFTLLELVVVILIMGVLVFILVPNLSVKYREVKFENFTYHLLQFFKSAQDSSFKENSLFEVRFEPGSFVMYKAEEKAHSLSIPKDYKIERDLERVVFYPTGLLKVYQDDRILNLAQIKIIFNGIIKRIVFYSEAGNVFIEE
jgi:hypothetical protein